MCVVGIMNIHTACVMNQLKCVQQLVEKDPTVIEKRDSFGMCPLHCAVESCSIKIVKYLLSKGCYVNAQVTNNSIPF